MHGGIAVAVEGVDNRAQGVPCVLLQATSLQAQQQEASANATPVAFGYIPSTCPSLEHVSLYIYIYIRIIYTYMYVCMHL